MKTLTKFINERLIINKDYNYTKEKKYFRKDDEWTNKCFDALKSYDNKLKSIDFGPNENLKDSLGKQIIEIIDKV